MSEKTDIGRELDGALQKPKRQLAMVFDLNKCLGCHTCSISCKRQWTRDEGMDNMWWAVVAGPTVVLASRTNYCLPPPNLCNGNTAWVVWPM